MRPCPYFYQFLNGDGCQPPGDIQKHVEVLFVVAVILTGALLACSGKSPRSLTVLQCVGTPAQGGTIAASTSPVGVPHRAYSPTEKGAPEGQCPGMCATRDFPAVHGPVGVPALHVGSCGTVCVQYG